MLISNLFVRHKVPPPRFAPGFFLALLRVYDPPATTTVGKGVFVLISILSVRHKVPPPRFAPGFFLALLVIFIALGEFKPIFGLVGMGTTLVVASVLVELNRNRIWELYKKTHKHKAGRLGFWTRPDPVYYNVNVMLLWLALFVLGVVCLWAAYVTL